MIERREGGRRRVGYGRRKSDEIHPKRWRLLAVWIALFTTAVVFALVQLRSLYNDIQQSRRESITFQCEQQNARHDATNRQLRILSAQAAKGASPERKRQLQQSVVSTSLLIDALVPKQDCDALADTLVK